MKNFVVPALIVGVMGTAWAKPPRKAALENEAKLSEVAFQDYSRVPSTLGAPVNPPGSIVLPPLPGNVPSTGGAIIQQPIPQTVNYPQSYPLAAPLGSPTLAAPQGMPLQLAPGQMIPGQMVPGQVIAPQMMVPQQPGIILEPSYMQAVALYTNVRIVEPRNMAPCAIPKIVSVPDPRNPNCCVFISICVPAGACEDVYYRPLLDRTVFDYGKYKVKVTNRHGLLVVNYDD